MGSMSANVHIHAEASVGATGPSAGGAGTVWVDLPRGSYVSLHLWDTARARELAHAILQQADAADAAAHLPVATDTPEGEEVTAASAQDPQSGAERDAPGEAGPLAGAGKVAVATLLFASLGLTACDPPAIRPDSERSRPEVPEQLRTDSAGPVVPIDEIGTPRAAGGAP